MRWLLPCLLVLLGLTGAACADEVRVAVAANFRAPLVALGEAFENRSGHRLVVSAGSTGQLAAQITHGAPFDVFLAADQARPAALIGAGLAHADSRITYAEGGLFLLLRRPGAGSPTEALRAARRISIANPRTAPYGFAAMQVLEKLGISTPTLAYAQSVAGVNAALKAGAVDAGFAALSSTIGAPAPGFAIARELHDPIRQDAVLLTRADTPAPAEFLAWLASDEAKAIIHSFGYHVD